MFKSISSDLPFLVRTFWPDANFQPASSNNDARHGSKFGVDAAIKSARERKIQRIYLQDDRPAEAYFMADCQPDYWVHSNGGALSFKMTAQNVLIVGGHLEYCLQHTLADVMYAWSKQTPKDHTMTLYMDAIFSNGKFVYEDDRYYSDFVRFMGIASYGRPGGETFGKVTLLETLGVIIKPSLQHEYLKRVLPEFARTLGADYRVVMYSNFVVSESF